MNRANQCVPNEKLCVSDLFNFNVQSIVRALEFVQRMAKRGRPRKKQVRRKPARLSTISSDEDDEKKTSEISNLPSPSQQPAAGNEPSGTTADASQDPSEDIDEKNTTKLTKNNSNKKKIILTGARKKDETSGDSDATEVYVLFFFTKDFSSLTENVLSLDLLAFFFFQ